MIDNPSFEVAVGLGSSFVKGSDGNSLLRISVVVVGVLPPNGEAASVRRWHHKIPRRSKGGDRKVWLTFPTNDYQSNQAKRIRQKHRPFWGRLVARALRFGSRKAEQTVKES